MGTQGFTRLLLYQQVANSLRDEVRQFGPRHRLDSESKLAKHFAVSLPTMREALRQLSREGLIERRQGSGTFTTEACASLGDVHPLLDKRPWLAEFPWKVIVEMNRQACASGKVLHGPGPANEKTRGLWEGRRKEFVSFKEVVDLCRECHRLAPFNFFNGNTFAGIARTLSQQAAQDKAGPTHAALFRSAVSHYVAGVMKPHEFDAIMLRITNPKELAKEAPRPSSSSR